MNTQDNGGPAFPVSDPMQLQPGTVDEMKRLASGISTRDYFAAKALPAIYVEACKEFERSGCPPNWREGVALDAYAMADEMLKARQS